VMHVFKVETSHRTKDVPSRKLWHALHEVDKYLSGQGAWLVNDPNDVVLVCMSGRRSPKAPQASSSIGG